MVHTRPGGRIAAYQTTPPRHGVCSAPCVLLLAWSVPHATILGRCLGARDGCRPPCASTAVCCAAQLPARPRGASLKCSRRLQVCCGVKAVSRLPALICKRPQPELLRPAPRGARAQAGGGRNTGGGRQHARSQPRGVQACTAALCRAGALQRRPHLVKFDPKCGQSSKYTTTGSDRARIRELVSWTTQKPNRTHAPCSARCGRAIRGASPRTPTSWQCRRNLKPVLEY